MVFLPLQEQSPAETFVDNSHEASYLTAEAPVSCIHRYQSKDGLWIFVSSFAQSSKYFLFEDMQTEKCHKKSSCVTILNPNVAKLRNR